jgi:hypothetical protein
MVMTEDSGFFARGAHIYWRIGEVDIHVCEVDPLWNPALFVDFLNQGPLPPVAGKALESAVKCAESWGAGGQRMADAIRTFQIEKGLS